MATTSLMNIINSDASALINNGIIKSMSVIDWGKAIARANEIIQKDILRHCGIEAFDPEVDKDSPLIDTRNNSPGFDLVVKTHDGKLARVQSKMRQVKGTTDFSRQVHFETTRRHSKKNEGVSSVNGHVTYSDDEFDFVMVSLVNVRKNWLNRNSVDNWSFSIIPISALVDGEKGCCVTHISSAVLKKYEYKINPSTPPIF